MPQRHTTLCNAAACCLCVLEQLWEESTQQELLACERCHECQQQVIDASQLPFGLCSLVKGTKHHTSKVRSMSCSPSSITSGSTIGTRPALWLMAA